MAVEAENALIRVLQYWSIEFRIEKSGKIIMELYQPSKGTYGEVYSAELISRAIDSIEYRVITVYGADKEPQEMVQKLAHAVMINPDKLVRNMMGIPMEWQFGNYLSHPMSGFNNDAWVLAFRQANLYIPLDKLGPDHESWGMRFQGEKPVVFDFAKQQTSYAEAGSFGQYLLKTYGVQKVKAFQKLSLQTSAAMDGDIWTDTERIGKELDSDP